MIRLPASVRVYPGTSPGDIRRSFDGLHALANGRMQMDALQDICSCSPTAGGTA